METRPAGRLYELALSVPWCMTDLALEALLSIAAREPLPEDEIAQRMHGPKSLAMRTGTQRDDSRAMQVRDGVARIPINGPITRYGSRFQDVSGGTSTESLALDLQRAIDDPAIRAVLFVVDSPGGEAIGNNELSDAIYAARQAKPVWAYIEGYGASAAYWIASACEQVIVDESALVGSIGTVMGMPDPTRRQSATIDFVSSQSPWKRPDPTSQAGRTYLQKHVDDYTEVFIRKVMRNRNISRDQVLAVGGGLLIGQQAIDAGLADRLGSEDDTIRQLAEQAQDRMMPALAPAKAPMRRAETHRMNKNFWSNFFGGMFGAAAQAEGAPLAALIESSEEIQPLAMIEASAPLRPQLDPVLQARMDALERQLAEEQTARLSAAAALFADGAVSSCKALPSERQHWYDAYLQAAQDDALHPGGRTAHLEAILAERVPHALTEELVATTPAGPLPNNSTPETLSEERHAALLAMTPLGHAVLDARRARGR